MKKKKNQIKAAILDADRALERAKHNIYWHDNAAQNDMDVAIANLQFARREHAKAMKKGETINVFS